MFSVKITLVGLIRLRDERVLPGSRLPVAEDDGLVDITVAVRSKGATTREAAEAWVAMIVHRYGFNCINAAYRLVVRDAENQPEPPDPSRQQRQEPGQRIISL